MADFLIPKKGAAYEFWVSLVSQADTKLFQNNPTLAAGDVQISKDGGALANIATIPTVTPASSKLVKVSLSATEMTADNVKVLFSDVAGAQWCDLMVNLQPSAAIWHGTITGASPTTTTLVDSKLTQADTNFWVGRILIFVSGNLRLQATKITAFNATTDQLTFDALSSAPAQNDEYVIV